MLALLPILVAALTTVLAAFAFLTLPASPDALSDLDVVTYYYCITIIIIVIVYIIIVIVVIIIVIVVIIIVITRVEIVLAAGGAVQQVTQLGWGQLGNLLGERISQ